MGFFDVLIFRSVCFVFVSFYAYKSGLLSQDAHFFATPLKI